MKESPIKYIFNTLHVFKLIAQKLFRIIAHVWKIVVQKDQSSVTGTQENGIIANSAGLLNTRLHKLDDVLNIFLQALYSFIERLFYFELI